MTAPRVYVDSAAHPLGRMIMCHMVSPDMDALHSMAARIGIERKWFQDPRTMPGVSAPHYDISKGKRALAVTCGAVEVTRHQLVAITRIAKNVYWEKDAFDPLGHVRNHPPEVREGLRRWLEREGWRV